MTTTPTPPQSDAPPVGVPLTDGDAVDGITRSIAALRGHIEAIQKGKREGGSNRPITDCINGLPEIVRWLDSALFDVEAEFERYEDRPVPAPSAAPAEPARGGELVWTQRGAGVDGDPLRATTRLGDMTAEVVLSRGTGLWSVKGSHFDGRLGLDAQAHARDYAGVALRKRAQERVSAAKSTLAALQAAPADPVAGVGEREVRAYAEAGDGDPVSRDLSHAARALAGKEPNVAAAMKHLLAARYAVAGQVLSRPVESEQARALEAINAIRNSIVGCQTVNFSEHVYPLVAALGAAGYAGLEYAEARENVGTLIERANAAEEALAALSPSPGVKDNLVKALERAHGFVCPLSDPLVIRLAFGTEEDHRAASSAIAQALASARQSGGV